jgi:hypothetical protein
VEGAQLLERNETVEVDLAGKMNDGHAAAADLADELVPADPVDQLHRLPPSVCDASDARSAEP